jgi:hypothetical protein
MLSASAAALRRRPASPPSPVALALLSAVSTVLLGAAPCEGARRKTGKAQKNPSEAYYVLKWIYICLFGPVILYFVYLVLRDPMTPHLLHELWCRAKEKTGAFLGPAGLKARRRPRAKAS